MLISHHDRTWVEVGWEGTQEEEVSEGDSFWKAPPPHTCCSHPACKLPQALRHLSEAPASHQNHCLSVTNGNLKSRRPVLPGLSLKVSQWFVSDTQFKIVESELLLKSMLN